MKITAICGTRTEHGRTMSALQEIGQSYQELRTDVDFLILDPTNYVLLPSSDPRSPFIAGADELELEKVDDTHKIKKILEKSDLIIFASPTYYANVTADFKLFIDRFCHLAHLYYFAGKPCQTLVVSDGNGHVQVSNYLKSFCEGLGLVRVNEIILASHLPLSRDDAIEISRSGISAIEHPELLEPTIGMETSFQHWKKSIAKQPRNASEFVYWSDNGLFLCDTLRDYFRQIRSKNGEN